MPKTNLELAQQTQEKFYFYMTALVFTVLGLSIQTASFGKSNFSDVFEIVSWILFLFSGLTALYRLELTPNLYESADGLNKLKIEHEKIIQLKDQGKTEGFIIEDNKSENIDEYLKQLNINIKTLSNHINQVKSDLYNRYSFHRWTLIFGFICVITARAYLPITNIIEACN